MKKIISVLMCLTLAFGLFVGCAKSAEQNYDIVMITDGASIKDGGYNESAWNGLTAYAIENAMTYHYYQPSLEDGELTVSGVEKYVKLAVKNGAQFIGFSHIAGKTNSHIKASSENSQIEYWKNKIPVILNSKFSR